jgi:enamine deaminase RidA (YjgF/YER057c/UK114 family)
MDKMAVNPPELPRPAGYSHGFEIAGGRLLFISGQVPLDRQGKLVGAGDLVAQFRQVCENLKTVVEARGGTPQDIVKLTIFVLDGDDYRLHGKAIGQAYRECFGRHYPAMSWIEVKGLFHQAEGVLLEIEGVASLP